MDKGGNGFGVSNPAGLATAAKRPYALNALVAVSSRIDLAGSYRPRVVTPTQLIAAERDTQALDMSRKALSELASDTTLEIVTEARKLGLAHTLETVPGVVNVFENELALQKVEQLATRWFTRYL